ncbi:MAG: hypothetical protein IJ735_04060, partial [Clostridia bacterium]|nr:hypothetical protein [Clostridia bacterium]
MALVVLTVSVLCSCGLFGGLNSKSDSGSTTNKVDLSDPSVRVEVLGTFNYTGEPIEPTEDQIRVYIGNDDHYLNSAQFSFSYSDNVEVGFGTIKIIAKEESRYTKGSTSVRFEIVPGYEQAFVTDLSDLQEKILNDRYSRAVITDGFSIEEGETLTVPKGKKIYLGGTWEEYTNKGEIVLSEDSVLYIGYNNESTTLINDGSVSGQGKIVMNAISTI